MKARVFIGSSAEAIPYADAVLSELERTCEVTPWYTGTFNTTNYTMEDLEIALDSNDFAIFICSPDDVAIIRDKSYLVTRDNTLFEMGLFWGKLRRGRVFFLIPFEVKGKGNEEYHLLSDLMGIEPLKYHIRTDANYNAAVRTACSKIISKITEKGKYIDIESTFNDLTSSYDQLQSASTFLFETLRKVLLNNVIKESSIEILELIVVTVTQKFDTHSGFNVSGVGLWLADNENNKIDHVVGKKGTIDSYSLNINEENVNERILVVDCFNTKEEVGFYKREALGSKYIFCYPLDEGYVLAVNINGRREMTDFEYNSTFFLNQKIVEIVNALLKEVKL